MIQVEPRIARFEQLAYGLFVHWGLYSLLGQGEWVQHQRAIPMSEYAKLAQRFGAEGFNGRTLARAAREAGMRYITMTTRHHDGFSLYDTRGLSQHDAPHSAAGRDLVADFVEGCRAEGIVPFFYHTTLDWYQDSFEKDFDRYLEYLYASIEILCTQYGDIGGFWFDGNWSKPEADWQEDSLYGMIRRHQPDAIIINNTGLFERGRVGNVEIDCVTYEQDVPSERGKDGSQKYLAAEACQSMNRHWGIATEDFRYLSPKDIIEGLCGCRKVGVNDLLNVGLTAEGALPQYEAAALQRAGEWVRRHASAIYDAVPLPVVGDGRDFAMETEDRIYLFLYDLAIDGSSEVTTTQGHGGERSFRGIRRKADVIRWMDNGEVLDFEQDSTSDLLRINASGYPYGIDLVVRVAELVPELDSNIEKSDVEESGVSSSGVEE